MAAPDTSRLKPLTAASGRASRALEWSAIALGGANSVLLLAASLAGSFTGMLGKSPASVSGASILAMSFLLTCALLGCSLAIMRRNQQLDRLLDEFDDTSAALVRAEDLASRVRQFKQPAERQTNFS